MPSSLGVRTDCTWRLRSRLYRLYSAASRRAAGRCTRLCPLPLSDHRASRQASWENTSGPSHAPALTRARMTSLAALGAAEIGIEAKITLTANACLTAPDRSLSYLYLPRPRASVRKLSPSIGTRNGHRRAPDHRWPWARIRQRSRRRNPAAALERQAVSSSQKPHSSAGRSLLYPCWWHWFHQGACSG